MAKVMSSGVKATPPGSAKVKGSLLDRGEDYDEEPFLAQLNQQLPDSYKQKILKQSRDLSDQDNSDEAENMVQDLLDSVGANTDEELKGVTPGR
jgi:hypothetical protein